MRDAEQLVVRELHARAGIAVVEQHFDAGSREFAVQALGDLADALGLLQIDRDQRHGERGDGLGPDDALVIVVLFDGRRHDARHTDAITAHEHRHGLALLVEHRGVHGLAVLAAELEDVAHLDAAGDAERALAGGARVAGHDVADVHHLGLGQVAAPVDPRQVHVAPVGAANEVGCLRGRAIGVNLQLQARRADEARLAPGGGAHLLGSRHLERGEHAGQLLRLDCIQFVIAPHDERDHAAVRALDQQGLEALRGIDLQEFGQLRDGARARGAHFLHRRHGRAARLGGGERLGHLDVGGVVIRIGPGDGVLARVGEHVELLRGVAADAARVGPHRAEAQVHAREDPRISLVHGLVTLLERRLVEVEGVGVLHRELAGAHHAEARADLVAELGLDLVEVHRQLAVAPQFLPRDVGYHFLRGRRVAELALGAVLDAQHHRPVEVPAPRLLPQLGRLHRRHQQLERPGTVHLLADDVLDLAQHPEADRQPGVEAGGQAADQAGPQHQLVAHDLGVGRYVAQGVDRVAGESHRGSGVENGGRGMLAEGLARPAAGRRFRCAGVAPYLLWASGFPPGGCA